MWIMYIQYTVIVNVEFSQKSSNLAYRGTCFGRYAYILKSMVLREWLKNMCSCFLTL